MTRLQKKCMAFSVGVHGVLLVVLIAGAAFAPAPSDDNLVLLNMIPVNILDKAGVGGGSPQAVAPQPPPKPAPPQPQPQAQAQTPPPPQAQPRQEKRTEAVRAVEPKRREERREITRAEPEPTPVERGMTPTPEPKPKRKPHEVQVDYTPASTEFHQSKKQKETDEARQAAIDAEQARAEARAAARAEARRQREIKAALDTLASGVAAKAADHAVVENEGDGGPSFADYGTVVGNIYYRAWITPDNAVNRLALTKVRIVVSRDGRVVSADIINPCGEKAVDASVQRTLRAVTSLPPFPAGAHDEQRTFLINFDLKAKEDAG